MKAILAFDLNKPDEQRKHLRTVHADDAFRVLWEIDQYLRSNIKYDDREEFQEVRDELCSQMEDAGISFDMYE